MLDPCSSQPLHLKIEDHWVQSFMERFQIVCRAQVGKPAASPTKQIEIGISVEAHLGGDSGFFESKLIGEKYVENADETHFSINVDIGHTLGFSEDKELKNADVFSRRVEFAMLVRLAGGRDSHIAAPFKVFKNPNCNYPIRNVPDTVPGVAFRTEKKGWMNRRVITDWLSKNRVISATPNNHCILYLENCTGHADTANIRTVCSKITTEVRYFPPNATNLTQPCDCFLIQK